MNPTAIDTKHGDVSIYNRCLVQQESAAALSKKTLPIRRALIGDQTNHNRLVYSYGWGWIQCCTSWREAKCSCMALWKRPHSIDHVYKDAASPKLHGPMAICIHDYQCEGYVLCFSSIPFVYTPPIEMQSEPDTSCHVLVVGMDTTICTRSG